MNSESIIAIGVDTTENDPPKRFEVWTDRLQNADFLSQPGPAASVHKIGATAALAAQGSATILSAREQNFCVLNNRGLNSLNWVIRKRTKKIEKDRKIENSEDLFG